MSELPDGWISLSLGQAGRWMSGGTPSTSNPDYWGGDIPWISSGSLTDFRLMDSDRRVTSAGVANGTRLVEPGTILMVVRGMSLKTDFRIGWATRPMAFGQDCKALVAGPGIDPTFLAYAILAKTPAVLGIVDEAGHGTGRLNTDQLFALTVSLPQPSEQKAIAEVLGALDDKIAVNTKLASTIQCLAEAMFRRLMSSATKSATLGSILTLEYGKSMPASRRKDGSVAVYGSGGVVGTHDQALLAGPGVVVGRKGTAGSVHWAAGPFYPIDTTFYVLPSTEVFPMIFCYFALRSLGLDEMNSDSAVPGLNRNEAHAAITRIPDATALSTFGDAASVLFQQRAQLQQESESLASMRNALLPQLMSGRIRVRDAEQMVGDVV